MEIETNENMINGQFIGTSEQKTDEKNRIIIPVKWRENLGPTCYLCSAPEGCIFVYTPEQWRRVTDQIADRAHNMAERARQRQFYIGATDANVDRQGRVTLPPILMKRVGIEKEIVVNGSGNRIEIWAKDRWYLGPANPSTGENDVFDEIQYPEDVNW